MISSDYIQDCLRIARASYRPGMTSLRVSISSYDEWNLWRFVRTFNYPLSHILSEKPKSNNIFWYWDEEGKSGKDEKIKKKLADEIPCLNETWYNEEEEEEEEKEEADDERVRVDQLTSHVLDLVHLD